VVYPQIVIGSVAGKIQDGRLVDEAVEKFLMGGVERLIQTVQCEVSKTLATNAG